MAKSRGQLGANNRPSARARKAAPIAPGFTATEQELAQRVRQTYVEARSAWERLRRGVDYTYVPSASYDRGTPERVVDDKLNRGKPAVWLTLAARFLQLAIDPTDYIYRLFEQSTRRSPPEPGQIFAPEYLNEYQSLAPEQAREECRCALQVQRQTAVVSLSYWQGAGLDFVRSHVMVLCDEVLELSALFRFCLAYELSTKDPVFQRVARGYEEEAARQFLQGKDDYLAVWGDWLPPAFVKVAEKLYQRGLEREDWHGPEEDN